MKVQYLTNIPAPYRMDFFSELSKYVDLTVIFERRSASDRDSRWQKDIQPSFKTIFLDAKKIGTDNSISFNVIKAIDLNSDVIVIGMYSTCTAMIAQTYLKRHKKPYFLNTDGGFVGNDNIAKRILKRYFISSASWWLTTGKLSSEYFEYYGASKDRIYIYPFSSIKSDDIQIVEDNEKERIREELGLPDTRIVISVGQFIYRKGFDLLIDAASMMDRSIYWIIIGGSPIEEYKKAIEKNKVNNIHFMDFMKPEILYKFYKAADLFVLPTREDIWGLVVNEAIAFGLPIVTTDRCIAGSEVISDGENGFIAKSDDVDDLKNKLELAISDEFLKGLNYSKDMELAQKYTIENMAKRHFEIFEEVCNI